MFDQLVQSNNRLQEAMDICTDRYKEKTMVETKPFTDFASNMEESIKSYINLDAVLIPVIEFQGSPDELSTVFENLNKTGSKLTKYQILAAAWDSDSLSITLDDTKESEEILRRITDRYSRLSQGRQMKIDGYNTDTFRISRRINLAEYAFALGQMIIDAVPSLYYSRSKSTKKDDLSDSVGFISLAIASDTDNRYLGNIADNFSFIKNNYLSIYRTMKNIASDIDESLRRYLTKPVVNQTRKNPNPYESGMNSDQKFCSYIAALWTCQNNKRQYTTTLKNIPTYFIIDDLNKVWKGSGDSRIATYFKNPLTDELGIQTYLDAPSYTSLMSIFNNWLDSELSNKSLVFSAQTKCLTTIHANCAYKPFLEAGENYDFEHIVAKTRLEQKNENNTKHYIAGLIPGGSVGNAMFLVDDHN